MRACIKHRIFVENSQETRPFGRLVAVKKCWNSSRNMKVYPKVSRLAGWSENCRWYSSVPLGAVVSLFCGSV
jgi:hypothetical protein